jgi:DNA-binding transcriptional ArsR family regulator
LLGLQGPSLLFKLSCRVGQHINRCYFVHVTDKDRCELLCIDLEVAERIRQRLPEPGLLEQSAARADALGDPTRLMVAAALAGTEELCVCDLAWVCGRSQNLVSHHLRALRHASLVRFRRDKKMVMYSLTDTGRHLVDFLLPSRAQVSTQ